MLRTRIVSLAFALLLLSPSSYGGGNLGTLRGVARTAEGAPVSGVQVIIHSLDENTDRSIVSDNQGAFEADNLRPGRYQLTAKKPGLASLSTATVDLGPQQSLRVDMTLGAPGVSIGTIEPARAADFQKPSANSNPEGPALTERERQLLERIDRLEQRLAALEARQASGADARSNPAQSGITAAAVAPPAISPKPEIQLASPSAVPGTPPASLDQGSINAGSPTQPVMVASLSGTAGVKPAEKPAIIASEPAATQAAAPSPAKIEPFSDADWTWLNGNPRTKNIYWDSKFFTPEVRADITYAYDFNHPADHSMGGSSEIFRSQEVQVEQLGVGGDFHYDNVRARLMTQFGMYSETTPRNDASPGHGQWDLDTAYRYVSEAYGGYHFNVLHGINVDAGIFMSYIGLFSYYNFDNWAYQPSYVSSNTPWFFNGVRVQIFPTAHLKIEPWFINGWQSYGSANHRPGLGGQIKWTPKPWINIISNNYGLGHDDLFVPNRGRIHTDDSVEVKYYDQPAKTLDKMAFTFTGDMGCEFGGGVSCHGNTKGGPKQSFLGYMLYNRFWFKKDLFGLTLGGGEINNPGRYLVLLPPINGETAISAATNSPYFTENPGDPFKAWDSSITFDWMPKQYITFRWEFTHRHANVDYWSGPGGITPPGGNNGFPPEYACMNGSPSPTIAGCNGNGGVWYPDLRKNENLIDMDILVKF
jgi:hypothetical protein